MEDYNNVNNEEARAAKSTKGYRILTIILVVILIVVSFILLRQTNQLKRENKITSGERDSIIMEYQNLRTDFDTLQIENANIDRDRMRLDSLVGRLQNERNLNYNQLRKYEQELSTMRSIMRRYVHQIDSLNQLNRALTAENINVRQQVNVEKLRADAAEEMAGELSKKVQTGALVKARDIRLVALRANDREVSRASRAERLRVDFILSANDITTPGLRNVYARIAGPDGYVLAGDTESLFDFEGDKITYSATREIDYQNQDLAVSLYYNGAGIVSGTYTVEIYMDGARTGIGETILK